MENLVNQYGDDLGFKIGDEVFFRGQKVIVGDFRYSYDWQGDFDQVWIKGQRARGQWIDVNDISLV